MIMDELYKSVEEGFKEFKTTVYPTLKTKRNFFTGKVETVIEIDYKDVYDKLMLYGICNIKLIRENE